MCMNNDQDSSHIHFRKHLVLAVYLQKSKSVSLIYESVKL